jgi:ADP-ribosylglycohydrolase
MRSVLVYCCALVITLLSPACGLAQPAPRLLEIPADTLEDKIRGGMLAQVLGNLNGLPHEFKYIAEPGNVEHYTPSLPDGAQTDDDTDIEWVYLREIARTHEKFLEPDRIAGLWKRHINRRIFCANRYSRDLMDLGIDPPWTGNVGLNPWSEFNISGQFVCESFGLMAPAMPQTAARLGLHYTSVAIDGEPAQATQLFTTMIATAFIETDMTKILDAGQAAVDPQSEIASVVTKTRQLCRENPDDWRKTRLAMKQRWQTQGGIVRERNGYELNTACVVAALIYGHNDFVETIRTAFNLGWDADCDAATAATIVGVIKGRRWMNDQQWDIKDIYRNTTRDDMPSDETLTGLEDLCVESARITIKQNGGTIPLAHREGQGDGSSDSASSSRSQQPEGPVYHIPVERPANVQPLHTIEAQRADLRNHFASQLERDLTAPGVARARAAYIAICLGESEKLQHKKPAVWSAAVTDLETNYPRLVHDLFISPKPLGDALRKAGNAAGLHDPKNLKLTERPLKD